MWKKLVSLNLALVMCLALMPVSVSAETEEEIEEQKRYADVYRNNISTDSEHKLTESFYTVTSDSNLYLYRYSYLYQAVPKFINPGKIVTTYNTSRDGSGTTYGLTSDPYDFFSRDQTNPPKIYAQWEKAQENYILYLGVGVGPTKDGKDYILDDNLSNTVGLRGEEAFAALGPSSKVIGWADKEFFDSYGTDKYYPGQKIQIDSNLTLFPITGYNYVIYHFYREQEPEMAKEAEFYTLSSNDSDKPIGLLDVSNVVFEHYRKRNEVFYGWTKQKGGAAEWYTGLAKNAPQHNLYACSGANPSEDFCILRSPLGFEGDEDDQRGGLNRTHLLVNKHVTDLPTFTSARYGYEFKGWYADKNYTRTVTADLELSSGSILYAKWEKKPEDKTYAIIIDGGGSLTTDSTGKLPALPTTPTKPGYIFGGWYTGPDGSGDRVTTDYIFTGPITIYPYWKPDGGKPPDKVYVIIIDGGGSVSTGSDGKLPALPAAPSRPGYIFDGWYTHPTGGDKVDTNYVFAGPITIYPHWRPEGASTTYYRIYTPGQVYGGSYDVSHTYAAPGTRVTIELDPWSDYELDWLSATNLDTGWGLSLYERYWDEYTFTMPYSDVEIDLSYAERYVRRSYYPSYAVITETQDTTGPYVWYYQDRHIYHITDGLVPDHTPITRDMFLSVLYNLAGNKGSMGTAVGSETNDAQAWATNAGIVPDIYASGLYGLDKPLTRDQAAMLLFRYAGYRGYSAVPGTSLARYGDYSRVRPIARDGLSWALSAGLMTQTSYTALSPRDTMTCGQAGDLIFRFEAGRTGMW